MRRRPSYRTIRRLHFALTTVLALPLLLLSVTGALLVYGPELQRVLTPAAWQVRADAPTLSPGTLIRNIERQRPDLTVWALSPGEHSGLPWLAWLADNAGVIHVDPADGRILTHYLPRNTFQGWVTALHRRWLVDGPAARWVRHGVSAIALLFTVQLGIGLWLWLRPVRRLRRLAVPTGRSVRLTVLRLHQTTGVASAVLLLLIAVTGIAMYWHAPTKALLEWLTASPVKQASPPQFDELAPLGSLDAAVALALATAGPDASLRSLRPPARAGEPAIVTVAAPGQTIPTRIWIGDVPPRVLYSFDGRGRNLATTLWHLRYELHVGTFAGPVVRALWLPLALLPSAFVVSGLWLHVRRRWRRRHPAAAVPAAGSHGTAAPSHDMAAR